jgi:ketosteroid isomerase-like protein
VAVLDLIRANLGDVGQRRWWSPDELRERAEANWDPEIVYEEAPGWPDADTFRGVDAVIARLQEYGEAMGELELEVEALEEVGDDRALVVICAHGKTTAGIPDERRWAYLLTFRDSKLVHWRAEIDPERARRELNLDSD